MACLIFNPTKHYLKYVGFKQKAKPDENVFKHFGKNFEIWFI